MKNKFARVLLSTILFVPNIYAMDEPPDHKETPSLQKSEHLYQFITPGMITTWSRTSDSQILLQIFGQDNQTIYETKLPILSLHNIAVAKDGTLYIFGGAKNGEYGDYATVIIGVKNGKSSERLKHGADMSYSWDAIINNESLESLFGDLTDIKYVGFAQDGTLLISGKHPKVGIYAVKDGKLELQAYDLEITEVMGSAPDGTIFIKKQENDNKFTITKIKDGKVLGDLGFRKDDFYNLIARPDGTLFIGALTQEGTKYEGIISVTKDGEVKFTEPQSYGLHQIDKFTVGPDGTLFIIGSKEKEDPRVILAVKNGQTFELPNYGWLNLIERLDVAPDGTIFIQSGEGIPNTPTFKQCILKVKDEKSLGSMCTEYHITKSGVGFNLQKISGSMTLTDILINEKEKVFPKGSQGEPNLEAFEKLCTDIQYIAPSAFSHEDGKALYQFFSSHIIDFQKRNSHAGFAMFKLLETLTSNEESTLYGYALALYLEISGLQSMIITTYEGMSLERLLDLKKQSNFKKRLEATQQVKEILEAIVSSTTPDFSKNYKRLLEKVNSALEALEPKKEVQAPPHPAR